MFLLVDGLKVKAVRKSLGMSQRECAKEAGISRKTLQDIEVSRRHHSPKTVRKLAVTLGVNERTLAIPKGRLSDSLVA